MAQESANVDVLKAYFGEPAYEEYRAIAERTLRALAPRHLGSRSSKNVIFVPGITGSLLQSRSLGGIWWIDARTCKHLNDLRLSADGRSDVNSDHDVVPCTTDPTYEPFLAALLVREDFGHVLFPYDWRKPLELSTTALRDKVLQVYAENQGQPVHLVAHSMGGLLVRIAISRHGNELWPRLGRIAFVGTPHFGSASTAGYLKNHLWGFELMALLATLISRETLRSLWGFLTLMPAPAGIYPGTRASDPAKWKSADHNDPYMHPCANFDLYAAAEWKLDLGAEQQRNLQTILNAVAAFYQELSTSHAKLSQEQRNRMAVIAGVGYKTLFRLAYQKHLWGLWESASKETGRIAGDPHREGDGRVPLASACLEYVGDTRFVRGVHANLPNLPAVHEDVFRWLNDEPMQLPESPAEALSRHLGSPALSGETPHLSTPAQQGATGDDPGYWNLVTPDASRLAELETLLDQEKLPDFNKIRLI
jgi:pimeloyl-ACP methyl ester carboxylesterase